MIADSGNIGNVCVGSFKDLVLYVSNSGFNPVIVSNITSSSGEFLVPSVLSYPLTIAPGTALEVPIRFQPISLSNKSATISVFSNDPSGPNTVGMSGTARPPRLALVIADDGELREDMHRLDHRPDADPEQQRTLHAHDHRDHLFIRESFSRPRSCRTH